MYNMEFKNVYRNLDASRVQLLIYVSLKLFEW